MFKNKDHSKLQEVDGTMSENSQKKDEGKEKSKDTEQKYLQDLTDEEICALGLA